MPADVDEYLATSERWPEEIAALRPILLGAGLVETIKWGKPCYVHEGKNVAIVQEFKGFLSLMFFKGILLEDPGGALQKQSADSDSPVRRVVLSSVEDVQRLGPTIEGLLAEAIAIESAGTPLPEATDLVLVEELQERLDADPGLAAAFAALTPGRRRQYNLHVSAAKQPATRIARVEQAIPGILAGKGLRDR